MIPLTRDPDAATRLHYMESEGALWLDPDAAGIETGVCVGVGDTLAEAILDAKQELQDRIADLDRAYREIAERVPAAVDGQMGAVE